MDAPPPPFAAPSRRNRPADALALAVITALALAYFSPLFAGRTNSILGPWGSYVYPWAAVPTEYSLTQPQTDYAELSYPWLVVTDRALEEGTIPFWAADAYGGGYDLYANGSSALLYPPRLLALAVTSPVRAHDLFLLFHLWASGVAMYLLARQLSLGRPAATFGAVAWMFATWNTAWMQLEVVTPMALFIPATFAAVHRALTTRRWTATLGAAVVFALAIMAGHLLLLGVVLVAATAYGGGLTVANLVRRRPPAGRRLRAVLDEAARPAVLLGLTGALAAVTLLPTALALRAGQREPFTYAELSRDFLAEPSMFQRLWATPPVPLTADAMQSMAFVGTVTAVLAVVGALSRRRPGAWLGRVLIVATFLVTVGTPLTWLVFRFVPAMDVFRPYTRLMVFAAFGMAVLGTIGLQVVLDAVSRLAAPRLRPRLAAGLVVVLAGLVTAATATQLMRLGRDLNPPFVPHEARYALPDTPLVDRLQQPTGSGWPQRALPVLLRRADTNSPDRLTFYGSSPLAVGVDTTSGYDSSVDRRTTTLLRVLQGVPVDQAYRERLPAAFEPAYDAAAVRFDLAGRLGVTAVATAPPPAGTELLWSPSWAALGAERVYSGPDGELWSVPDALAGPRLVGDQEVVDGEEAALGRFVDPAFPAAGTVVVERAELDRTGLEPLDPTAGAAAGAGEVVSAERGVNTVEITVRAPGDGPRWLVLPDSWARGWTATVDGDEVPVVRVNFDQRAVQVPAGESTVSMRYRSPGFTAGLALSVLALGGTVGAGAVLVLRSRRRGGTGSAGRFELEDELVAEHRRVEGDPGLVDPTHQ